MKNVQVFAKKSEVSFTGAGWQCPLYDIDEKPAGFAFGASQKEALERALVFEGATITEGALRRSITEIESAVDLLLMDYPDFTAIEAVKLLRRNISSNKSSLRGEYHDDSTAIAEVANISRRLRQIINDVQGGNCENIEAYMGGLHSCLNHADRLLDAQVQKGLGKAGM